MIDIFLCDKREENERERGGQSQANVCRECTPTTGDVRNDLSGDEILDFFLSENIVLGAGDFHQDCGIGHHSLQFIET